MVYSSDVLLSDVLQHGPPGQPRALHQVIQLATLPNTKCRNAYFAVMAPAGLRRTRTGWARRRPSTAASPSSGYSASGEGGEGQARKQEMAYKRRKKIGETSSTSLKTSITNKTFLNLRKLRSFTNFLQGVLALLLGAGGVADGPLRGRGQGPPLPQGLPGGGAHHGDNEPLMWNEESGAEQLDKEYAERRYWERRNAVKLVMCRVM